MKNFILIFFGFISLIACKQDVKKTPTESFEKDTDSIIEELSIEEIKIEIEPSEKTIKELKEELTAKGFQTFDYVDAKTQDTILMQQYFMAFLKSGPIRTQNEEEATLLQEAHLTHLGRMHEEGYADLIGPFGDDGSIRGVVVYTVPTLKMADSLANLDPMVKTGRLAIEIHPWWTEKGGSLK